MTTLLTLVTIIPPVVTYGCEARSMMADMDIRINACETNCMRRLQLGNYTNHITFRIVLAIMESYIGVKQSKLQWLHHIVTRKNSLARRNICNLHGGWGNHNNLFG